MTLIKSSDPKIYLAIDYSLDIFDILTAVNGRRGCQEVNPMFERQTCFLGGLINPLTQNKDTSELSY